MILYVNSCVRDNSRTDRISRQLLKLLEKDDKNVMEVFLPDEGIFPLSKDRLAKRDLLLKSGNVNDEIFKYAIQFAKADTIVIAAPYWDSSFPAILKTYLENVYVTGIVTKYGIDGKPCGLCNANKLYYVTTAGGPYAPDYSYNYIKSLALDYFGIKETKLIVADMLDIDGTDSEKIVEQTILNLSDKL